MSEIVKIKRKISSSFAFSQVFPAFLAVLNFFGTVSRHLSLLGCWLLILVALLRDPNQARRQLQVGSRLADYYFPIQVFRFLRRSLLLQRLLHGEYSYRFQIFRHGV